MIGRKRLHTKINNQLCSLFCFTMILNQCMTITANLVVPKHGISLSEIQRLNLNEFGSETDELVFQYEIELAWDEIRMKQANHEKEVYPFLACHSNSELSGYDRRLELAQFLGLSTIEADKWNVLSNDKEKTCFIATIDTDISMLRERNDSIRWSQFRSKHMTLIPYTMHMKIRPHDNVSNTAGYRILTISLCDGILSDYRNFAAVTYVEELVTTLRIDVSAMNQHIKMTSKIMNQKQFSLNLQEKSHKYRRALVNEQLAFVCQSLSYVVSQGPSENSVLFEIPNSKQTFDCETYYLALLSSHSAFCSISSFDYTHQVKLANYEAQWIAQSGVPNYRPFWSNSLAGSNEIIGVVDDGLDIDNCYFYDPNISSMIKDGRFYTNSRKVVQYVSSSGDDETSDGDHGTFVAGTIAGSRIGDMPGLAEGIAKDARIAFFDIGTSAGISIPSNPSQLYGSTLSNGAFIQNNSWTLNTNTYHAICASLDSFVFSNPNLVLVFAAGNLENDKESIDRQYTVTCPGIAKNVITVGASQSIQGRSWYGSLGEDYIAPFSSAGPSLDGRIKPDIIAPGDYLLSSNSKVSIDMECDPPAEYYISPFSASNYGIRYDKGTSVSAAVVSGAAAIVRQYFREGWFKDGEKGSGPPTTPSAALVKAVLLNGGKSLIGVETWNSLNGGVEVVSDYDHNQGYGRVNLLESLSLENENGYKIFFVDNEIMQNGIIRVFNYQVADELDSPGGSCTTMDASITLAWTDPAGSEGCLQCLVNNLDMLVIHTSIQNNESKTYYPNGRHAPDTVNNVERTRIPFYDTGDLLRVQISGNLSTSTQAFALVVRIGCLNNHPTSSPSLHPSFPPSTAPSKWPSRDPSSNPSIDPTNYPSLIPSKIPSLHPSFIPSLIPSTVPSRSPTNDPTKLPSIIPSSLPTINPSEYPSLDLSNLPSRDPTFYPSMAPTLDPSKVASNSPSIYPTISPSLFPSHIPSIRPSFKHSQIPSSNPSHSPSRKPSPFPISIPMKAPSISPSFLPSSPLSMVPSSSPSGNQTSTPTDHPSIVTSMPTLMVSSRPSPQKSVLPTKVPSLLPTLSPIQTISTQPSNVFSSNPTTVQSWNPSEVFSQTPTNISSVTPSTSPTTSNTFSPSMVVTLTPSLAPTNSGIPSSVSISLQLNGLPNVASGRHRNLMSDEQVKGIETVMFDFFSILSVHSRVSIRNVTVLDIANSMTQTRMLQNQASIVTIELFMVIYDNTFIPYDQLSDAILNSSQQLVARIAEEPSLSTVTSVAMVESPSSSPSLPPRYSSNLPSEIPSALKTSFPSSKESRSPTDVLSFPPSLAISMQPSASSSERLSSDPTLHLTMIPSRRLFIAPSFYPSLEPTLFPSQKITHHPSVRLSASPSAKPTQLPTFKFTNEHNHLGPSSKPSSKPTSKPSISNFPSMAPSNIDIAFPLIMLPTKSPSTKPTLNPTLSMIPSTSPTSKPSRFPSSQPSLTPPVISLVEIPYIRESNATGNEDIATNETELFYTKIYTDDLELYERLEYKYANNCTIDDCRRLEEEFRPINVLNVSTSVNETEVCIASNANNTCHYLLTSVKIEHYPVQFSRRRVELEVLSKTLEYMDDRLITIRPLIPVPQPLESSISITFIGVTTSELESVELVQLLDTTFNFLQDLLGEYDPPILMESIAFNKQTLTVEVVGVEENTVSGSRHLNITDSSPQITQANITIDITIRGEYLPPPDVDFSVVLVDIFDEENEEYIDEIEKSENTYFAGIIDKIKVVTKANDTPALNRNNDNTILGVHGLSIITSSSVLVIALCSACLYKKHLRKIKSNKAADDLRRQAMEIAKNDLSLPSNESSMTLGQMNNLRATHRTSTLNVPSGFDDITLSNTDDDGSRLRFSTTSNLSSESPWSSRRFSRQFNGNSFSNTFDTTRESRSPPIINAVIVEASDSNMVGDESMDGSTSSAIDIDGNTLCYMAPSSYQTISDA